MPKHHTEYINFIVKRRQLKERVQSKNGNQSVK